MSSVIPCGTTQVYFLQHGTRWWTEGIKVPVESYRWCLLLLCLHELLLLLWLCLHFSFQPAEDDSSQTTAALHSLTVCWPEWRWSCPPCCGCERFGFWSGWGRICCYSYSDAVDTIFITGTIFYGLLAVSQDYSSQPLESYASEEKHKRPTEELLLFQSWCSNVFNESEATSISPNIHRRTPFIQRVLMCVISCHIHWTFHLQGDCEEEVTEVCRKITLQMLLWCF